MNGLLVELRHAVRMLGRRPAFTLEAVTTLPLGASRLSVLQMVLVQAGAPVLLGLGAGLATAVALAVALGSVLHGVTPTDPLSMLAVTAGLAAAAPARRAARLEPSTALRAE